MARVDKIKKTGSCVPVFMFFAFVYMPMDAMNERKSGVCSANAPLLLSSYPA